MNPRFEIFAVNPTMYERYCAADMDPDEANEEAKEWMPVMYVIGWHGKAVSGSSVLIDGADLDDDCQIRRIEEP